MRKEGLVMFESFINPFAHTPKNNTSLIIPVFFNPTYRTIKEVLFLHFRSTKSLLSHTQFIFWRGSVIFNNDRDKILLNYFLF